MRWIGPIVVLAVLGCDRSSAPASPSTEPPPSPSPPPPAAASQEASTGDAPPPATTTVRDGDGRCTPEPKAGAPCGAGDSWCVLSWGEPGGFSSALWCRNGRWEREEEANLDG